MQPQTTRNPDWVRDELVLALSFYLKHRPNPPSKNSEGVCSLSALLIQLGGKLFPSSPRAQSFRNVNSVYMKLMNFRRLDPQYTSKGKKGLTRGAKAEVDVWNEFHDNPARCHEVAQAIKTSLAKSR